MAHLINTGARNRAIVLAPGRCASRCGEIHAEQDYGRLLRHDLMLVADMLTRASGDRPAARLAGACAGAMGAGRAAEGQGAAESVIGWRGRWPARGGTSDGITGKIGQDFEAMDKTGV